tara:strand:+ start:84592 stop:85416 length:825 start_codon:yes stop_codon:yes gene_type:complete
MSGKKDKWGFWIKKNTPELVGKTFENSKGHLYTVLNRLTVDRYLIVFHKTGFITSLTNKDVKSGMIKDLYAPEVYGVGYMGEGVSKRDTPLITKAYATWSGMMRRCYAEWERHKNPSYAGCVVSDDWHHFREFLLWFEDNYIEGFHLDKDVLSPVGYKVYSKDTCEYVPRHINTLFTNTKAKRGAYPQGVYYKKKNRKFVAQVCNGRGIQTHLGLYDTPEEAYAVYMKKKMEVSKKILRDALNNKCISDKFYVKSIKYLENQLKGEYECLINVY